MDAITLIKRLHQHRTWVNHNLLTTVATLSDEQLRRPLMIGQGSIWKSLLHLYAAEYVWLESLLGNETPTLPGDLPGRLPGNQLGEFPILTLPELIELWQLHDTLWTAYFDTLTLPALDEIVYKTSTSFGLGKRFGTPRSDVLLHVCTHAHYTVAQVMNMLRQVGCEHLPETMLITLSRSEPNALATDGSGTSI